MYSGIAPILLSQLQSTNDKVYIPMVIGCLGNFCSEEKCRNYLLTNRVIEIVFVLFNKVRIDCAGSWEYYLNQDIMENCVFLFKNAFTSLRCSSQSRLRELKAILQIMEKVIAAYPKQVDLHTGILGDMIQFALSVIENNDLQIGMLVMPIISRILSILTEAVVASREGRFDVASNYPTKSILENFGNICAENDAYVMQLIDNGFLSFLNLIYTDPNNDDALGKLEVLFCWMNVSGGKCSQVLFDTGLLQPIVENIVALNPQASDIQFEAARRSMVILCNFICECNDNVSVVRGGDF